MSDFIGDIVRGLGIVADAAPKGVVPRSINKLDDQRSRQMGQVSRARRVEKNLPTTAQSVRRTAGGQGSQGEAVARNRARRGMGDSAPKKRTAQSNADRGMQFVNDFKQGGFAKKDKNKIDWGKWDTPGQWKNMASNIGGGAKASNDWMKQQSFLVDPIGTMTHGAASFIDKAHVGADEKAAVEWDADNGFDFNKRPFLDALTVASAGTGSEWQGASKIGRAIFGAAGSSPRSRMAKKAASSPASSPQKIISEKSNPFENINTLYHMGPASADEAANMAYNRASNEGLAQELAQVFYRKPPAVPYNSSPPISAYNDVVRAPHSGPRGVNGAYQSGNMAKPNSNPYPGRYPAGPRGIGGRSFKGKTIRSQISDEWDKFMHNEAAAQGPYGDYDSFELPYPNGTMFD